MNVVTIAMGKGKEEIMGIYLNPSTENFGNLGLSHNGASLLEQPSTKTIKSEAILKCRNKNAIRENGMTNCDFRSMDDLKDPVSHFVYDLLYSDAQIDGILHCLPAVICGTIVNIRSGYLIVPVYVHAGSQGS